MTPIKSYLFLFLLLFFICANQGNAQPGQWSEPVNISNNYGISSSPDMVVDNFGKIHVVWEDNARLGWWECWWDILYACFDGFEWSTPVQISGMDTTYSFSPRIAVDSEGYPHVVWDHNYIFTGDDIYYTTLTDSGWTEPINLTPWGTSVCEADIVVDLNDNVHVVWGDLYGGGNDIWERIYNGEQWSEMINVTNDQIENSGPRIIVDSENNLHLAFVGGHFPSADIHYCKYDGYSWSPAVNVSNLYSFYEQDPNIAVDILNNPHIVWKQGIGGNLNEIYYCYFDGQSWHNPENLTNLESSTGHPSIVIRDDMTKFVLFSRYYGGEYSYVNYVYSIDTLWSEPEPIYTGDDNWRPVAFIDQRDSLCACFYMSYGVFTDIAYINYQWSNFVRRSDTLNYIEKLDFSVYPNPSNNSFSLEYNLDEKQLVEISIYNIIGQRLWILKEDFLSAGNYVTSWDGRGRDGNEYSGGIYFLRLKIGNEANTKKIILLR